MSNSNETIRSKKNDSLYTNMDLKFHKQNWSARRKGRRN